MAGSTRPPFGPTLGELVNDIGGGTRSGRPIRAVQVGGPLGAYFPPSLFDTAFDYEAFAACDGLLGHGGIVVFNDSVDMKAQARFAMEFCTAESCGKCTPCRIGSVRGVEVVDKIVRGQNVGANIALLRDLCDTMKSGSLCALGGFVPYPVLSALNHFPRGLRAMSDEIDRGTPASKSERTVSLVVDGAMVEVPEGTSILRAASLAGFAVPKLCATGFASILRLLPALPGRGRRQERHARLLHHAGGAGHGRAYPDREAQEAAPRGDRSSTSPTIRSTA